PDDALIGEPGVVCIPHLGASTPESEENCAVMAADQLREYLLNGNIVNSVNLPDVNVPKNGGGRICVIHKNIKGMLAGLTAVINGEGLNIENLTNKSRGEFAYTVADVSGPAAPAVADALVGLEGVIRVRVL
ncbi:MAG: 3-phosphoglycerate dehydrogenase, partial [Oscillospiraceae bacterium]